MHLPVHLPPKASLEHVLGSMVRHLSPNVSTIGTNVNDFGWLFSDFFSDVPMNKSCATFLSPTTPCPLSLSVSPPFPLVLSTPLSPNDATSPTIFRCWALTSLREPVGGTPAR